MTPVEGNFSQAIPSTSSKSDDEALVGISIELIRLSESPFKGSTVNNRQPKRLRHDSSNSDIEDETSDEENKTNKQIPPSKRRKTSVESREDDEPAVNGEEEAPKTDKTDPDSIKTELWKDAEEEFRKWREAQENVFWKQVSNFLEK